METKNFYIKNITQNRGGKYDCSYYILDDIYTKFKNGQTRNFYGQYYPINILANYTHFLVDGVGGYLELKKTYTDLKPIFFIVSNDIFLLGHPNVKANYEILKVLDAEIVDITKTDCYFEQIITPHSYVCSIPVNEFYHFLNNNEPLDSPHFADGSWREIKWFNNASKELKCFLNSNNTKSLEKNIYVSRSRINQKYIQANRYRGRIHPVEYDHKLDNIMKDLGYEVVFSEDLGLFEQIDLFNKAKNFMTIEGGSLFNSIWCHDKANIVALKVLQHCPGFSLWEGLFELNNKTIKTITSFGNNYDENLECIKDIIKLDIFNKTKLKQITI